MELHDELIAIVGRRNLLTDGDVIASACIDATGRFGGTASAVVRPATTAEVSAVVEACARAGVSVVPQGGNTGLVGGGVPRGGEIVLSTGRLDTLGIDEAQGRIMAGAGVTLAALHEACHGTGWRFPLDFGARGRATVGGMIATNAGGVHVMRHGTMRRRVLGLEVVLADGTVLGRLLGLAKDSTGYDLSGLLCGSEGTLGVVTGALLELAPVAEETVVAWVTVESMQAGLDLSMALAAIAQVEAIEFVGPECTDAGCAALVVEAAGESERIAGIGDLVEGWPGVTAVEVATGRGERERLWSRRESLPARIRAAGVPVKLDIAVPPVALGEFLAAVGEAVARVAPDSTTWRFGHAGDGNVHVNVTGIDPHGPTAEAVEEAVLRLAVACGGTIAAEHGIGVAKARWLHLSRSPEELSAMRAIKAALDPAGLLNPGVLGL
ncbi:MAG: FAD-binding oxidoreductase [Microthrixaceae bacterium]|nr:FAD-binding oxidoreductase [Microthrixaceae bacterium]